VRRDLSDSKLQKKRGTESNLKRRDLNDSRLQKNDALKATEREEI